MSVFSSANPAFEVDHMRSVYTILRIAGCCVISQQAKLESPVLSTRKVEVDGIALRVRTAGLESRQAGQPAVVFESGASALLETWDSILADVTKFAPVIAYDRSGTGASPWDGLPPTPERAGVRLRRLLEKLNIDPPYVLVGHSWGGALVRFFAQSHPEDVTAILCLDPTDSTLTEADMITLFQSFGASETDYETFMQTMDRSLVTAPAPMRAEAAGMLSEPRTRITAINPNVPSSVILWGFRGNVNAIPG